VEILIGLIILYVFQAALIYGMTFGYFEGKYPNMGNVSIAFKMAVIGGILPVLGPLIIFVLSEKVKHGFRYK
jgi:uncharacterized membrane protein